MKHTIADHKAVSSCSRQLFLLGSVQGFATHRRCHNQDGKRPRGEETGYAYTHSRHDLLLPLQPLKG